MARFFLALATSSMLLVALVAPAAAQQDPPQLLGDDQVTRSLELLLDEVAMLTLSGAFEPNPTLDTVIGFYDADFSDTQDMLDTLDDAESDAEAWLGVLQAANFVLSDAVVEVFSYSPDSVEDGLLDGQTGFVDPTPWLDAVVDLLRRRGQAPVAPRSIADHVVIIQLIEEAMATGDFELADYEDPASAAPLPSNTEVAPAPSDVAADAGLDGAEPAPATTADAGTDVGAETAPAAAPSVQVAEATEAPAEPADQPAATTADTGGTDGPPVALFAGIGFGALALLGGVLLWRRKPTDQPAPVEARSETGLVEMLETSRRMTAALDADEIRRIAVQDAVRMTKAEAGAMVLRTPDGLRFVQTTHSGLFRTGLISGGVLARVVETGQPSLLVSDDDPGLERLPIALAAAPVVADGGVVGALVVLRAATNPFGPEAAKALELLTPVTGSALAAAATHNTAVTAADVDGLTNLNNRRRLDRDLAGLGTSDVVGFAMIDVDHFKQFNDTNGHGAGDVALQSVAQAIAAAVREGDLVYRYGGEEFSVLLRDCTQDDAAQVMERVRASVEGLSVPGGENQPLGRLTISAGVVVGPAANAVSLPKLADDALYRAKEDGRNRVIIHGS